MTLKELRQYTRLRKEIETIEEQIDKHLQALDKVPTVKGKVQASMRDHPYTLIHVPVDISDPRQADIINTLIRHKQMKIEEYLKTLLKIEEFISNIADSTDRQIFESVFICGMTYQEAADLMYYGKNTISRRIRKIVNE